MHFIFLPENAELDEMICSFMRINVTNEERIQLKAGLKSTNVITYFHVMLPHITFGDNISADHYA